MNGLSTTLLLSKVFFLHVIERVWIPRQVTVIGKLAAASPLQSADVEEEDVTVGPGLLPVARGKYSPASSSRRGGSWSP